MLSGDHWKYYPDIEAAGGLSRILETTLERFDVKLKSTETSGPSHATFQEGHREAQACLASERRLIMSSCSRLGVGMGSVQGPDIDAHAAAIAAWFKHQLSAAEMQRKFPFFNISDGAIEIEEGRGVDYYWSKFDKHLEGPLAVLIPLAEAAKLHTKLRQLRPFTSHCSLWFSASLGYPFIGNFAHAIPIENGRFRAQGPTGIPVEKTHDSFSWVDTEFDILGEGDADFVIDLIVNSLPPDCGPAIFGSAETLSDGILNAPGDLSQIPKT